MILSTVLLVLLFVIGILFIVFQLRGSRSFAPWVPSHLGLLKKVLNDINLAAGSTFIDLGSGDGRAVFLAAKKFHLRAIGVELSPLFWFISCLRLIFSSERKNITLIRGNLYDQPLAGVSIIYIYGLPENINGPLRQKLLNEVRPGTWLISYNFSLHEKKPQIELRDKWRTIRAYQI